MIQQRRTTDTEIKTTYNTNFSFELPEVWGMMDEKDYIKTCCTLSCFVIGIMFLISGYILSTFI